jgi:hypothetical protein
MRALIPLPEERVRALPYLFLVVGKRVCLVTPLAAGARISDLMAAEIEEVRQRVLAAIRSGELRHAVAAWVGETVTTAFQPVSPSWVQAQVAHHVTVPLAASATSSRARAAA